ncbi:MAG: hypothetical protein SPH30_07350 [Prevotella sp.]|nr:hypothetical protein [Prevotella sp.]
MKRKYIIPVCNISYMAHGPLILAGSGTGNGTSQTDGQGGDRHEAKDNTFFDEDEDESSPANYDLWK